MKKIFKKANSSLRIELFGVRGSLPAPRAPIDDYKKIEDILLDAKNKKLTTPQKIKKYMKEQEEWKTYGYGGHTSCAVVNSKKSQIIIDAGSGIMNFGAREMKLGRQPEYHLFMTHFHWDHIIGLPFFTPIFIPGTKIHIYGIQDDLESVIKSLFKKPYFPVEFRDIKSEIVFHKLELRKSVHVEDMSLTPYLLDHPDPCVGYRVESNGKSYSHVVDTEMNRFSREELALDLPLYQSSDVMLFDAQYTLREAAERIHWGHASASIGLELALRENVKNILFVHHDPMASDAKIAGAKFEVERSFETYKKLAKMNKQKLPKIKWMFAREGQVIEI